MHAISAIRERQAKQQTLPSKRFVDSGYVSERHYLEHKELAKWCDQAWLALVEAMNTTSPTVTAPI
jgi:hypothetical protein